MLLADRYASILMLFAVMMCILSMYTVQLFDHFSPSLGDKWDWISETGDWVVNFLYIGGSMGVLAWAKIWVGNPSFNSGEKKSDRAEIRLLYGSGHDLFGSHQGGQHAKAGRDTVDCHVWR